MTEPQTAMRICPICEAGCGLKVSVADGNVIAIDKNIDDVFSEGHVCAKGLSLKQLHDDPDRLTTPYIRRDGKLQPATWDEALAEINTRLSTTINARGKHSVAIYAGNPTAHNFGLSQGLGAFATMLAGAPVFSAGSVDQLPKQLASEFMFGNSMAVPVPDIERCDLLLMLGANPVVSNGSMWMVPKIRDRIRALQNRDGKLITVDPRRTETARVANEHHFIRPGTDAWLLIGLINELKTNGKQHNLNMKGWDTFSTTLDNFSLDACAAHTGINTASIQHLATQMTEAKHPVCYGRVGTTLQEFGCLTSFLIEVLNAVLGALDEEGGAMFPDQPYTLPGRPKQGVEYNRFQTRVSGYPEVLGQMPAASLAEEILTPGPGQIKALVTFAGNPAVSHPDSDGIEAAFKSLDFLLCIDIYHNESTKHADVLLPGTSPFEDSHYDQFLGSMGYRNVARYSSPVLESTQPSEWRMGLHLAYMTVHQAVATEDQIKAFEDDLIAGYATAYVGDKQSPLYGRDVQELMAAIGPTDGVERILDLGIRAGRWGDHFSSDKGSSSGKGELTLAIIQANPNGIDLGLPSKQRLREVVHHGDGKIDFAPPAVIADFERLQVSNTSKETFQLIGRRRPQSNNSWLRNIPMLTKTKSHCVLEMSEQDAERLNISDGQEVILSANQQSLNVAVVTSEDIAPGVVSLPHGFSQDAEMNQTNSQKGPNYNRLVPANRVDALSATSALNGAPVTIQKVS